jgi:translation initiation factor 3 subunit A
MYHEIARNIFSLCAKYKRKNDFRRFTVIIREHVASALSQPPAAGEPDTAADAHRLYLKTRLDQLNTASALELWSEAYNTISDIHDTIRQTDSPVAAYPTLLHIYEKLASFFWSSRDYLLTAYAIHQFQRLAQSSPEAREEALKDADESSLLHASQEDLFSYILLACLLARPSSSNDNSLFTNQDPSLRFAALLGLSNGVVPSRPHLLATISSSGILAKVNKDTTILYKCLEKPTSPLSMKRTMMPAIAALTANPYLSRFVQPIYDLTVVRVLQRLGDVYTIVTMDHFASLVPDMTWAAIEKIILRAINSNFVHVRIDHRDQVLQFSSPSLEMPPLCSQLSRLSSSLAPIIERVVVDSSAEREKVRASIFNIVRENLDADHERVFQRKEEIRTRKEREEETQRQAAFKLREAQELAIETKRQEEEAARERERIRLDKEAREKAAAEQELKKKQEMAEVLAKTMTEGSQQTKAAKKVANLTTNLAEASQEELIEASRKLIAQQKAEREKRLSDERKNLDYLTRACRLVERDLLMENQDKLESEAKEQHAAAIDEYMARHKANYEHAHAEKIRLGRMLAQRDSFATKILAERKAQHEAALAEYKVKKAEYEANRAEREAREAEERAEREAAEEAERAEREAAEEAERAKREAEQAKKANVYVPAHLRNRR